MLFTLGHGQHIVVEAPVNALARAAEAPPPAVVPLDAVLDRAANGHGAAARSFGAPAPAAAPGGPFGYYFEAAADASAAPDMPARLDALADAMVEFDGDPEGQNSGIPPVFTYFGQFIDHDITANKDRETGASQIDGAALAPLPRAAVVGQIFNLRNGALELDSLYGDGPGQGAFSRKLARLMRHPSLKAKMRLGVPTATDANRPPLPADPAADLLRLGKIVGTDPETTLTLAELQALNPDLRRNFLDEAGNPIIQKAIIGDARNDENLVVAQLHCAFLRFHNKVVDAGSAQGIAADALFDWARQRVRWHYQWLVVNSYLPAICDPDVVSKVKAAEAPIYAAFHDRHAAPAGARMPLPLEFSVAAFRFGHSMVRAQYDHNRFFGRTEGGSAPILDRAPFEQLFNFTGNGSPPMAPGAGAPSSPTLPNNWIIEWDRFVEPDPALADRGARRIDTDLAPPLSVLKNEPAGVFKHLARRNLRRGHRLNIPSAQDCITGINGRYGNGIAPLPEMKLTGGKTGEAVRAGGFAQKTPLWFYILKEAEENAGGAHLGQLGSTLVAETLIGLVVKDEASYWHQAGSDNGRWHPRDGARPGGVVVDSVAAMLKAAGVL